MRRIGWLVGVVTLLASGGYVFVYLYRWEWHRALIVGVLFIAAELALSTALVLRRLATVQGPPDARREGRPVPDPEVVSTLRANAPRREPFAWLQSSSGRTNVFIPVLLGSGVVVSAVAWVVERIAGRTAEPAMQQGLARQLSALAFPAGGLVADDGELLAQEGRSTDDDDDVGLLIGPRSGD